MTRQPLHWRLLEALDRAREIGSYLVGGIVLAVALGWISLPRRQQPGSEEWMAARRAARERLVTDREQRSRARNNLICPIEHKLDQKGSDHR
jgi:hypothetical protein